MMRAIPIFLVVSFGFAAPSPAQIGTISPGSVAAGWSGWAQCQVDTAGPSYYDRQTHTWVLTGAAPTMQGVFAIHPATWSVVGSGTAQRTSGSQPSKAEWTTNVTSVSAPMAISVRTADKRIVIRPWHDRLGVSAAIKGTEQATTTVATRAPAPTPLAFQAWESTFPTVEGNPSGVISGSSTLPTNGTTSPMQATGSARTTACTWQFAQAPTQISGPPAPPSQSMAITPVLTVPTVAAAPTATKIPAPAQPASTPSPSTPHAASPTLSPAPKTMTATTGCTQPGPTLLGSPVVTPGGVTFTWQRHPTGGPRGPGGVPSPFGTFRNVTYRVSRSDLGGAPLTEINAAVVPPGYPVNAPPPVGFAHRAPLDYRSTHVYTLSAHFSHEEISPIGRQGFDDGCGITQVSVTAPRPGTPDITSVTPGPGRVSVSWSMATQGQTGYLILGAGLPQEGREFPAFASSADITGLQPGTHTWLLAPFWDTPGGRMIDVSTGRSLSATVR